MTDTQIGGLKYDYLKGAVGTAILGVGGAAAGIKNEQQQVFKCPDCGQTLTYAMPEEVKQLIDIGVTSLDARQRLTLRGTPIEWEFLKNKYKNIEHGVADDIAISREEEKNERKNREGSLDWQVNLDYTSAEGKAYLDERKAMLDKEMAQLSPKFSREAILERQQNERKKRLQEYLEQHKQLQSELDSLGFFKFAEKEKLRKKLADNQEEIDFLQDLLDNPDEEDKEALEIEREVEEYKMSVYSVIKVVGWALTAAQIQDILTYYGLPTLTDPMRNFYTAYNFDKEMNIHNMEYKGVLGDRCFYYLVEKKIGGIDSLRFFTVPEEKDAYTPPFRFSLRVTGGSPDRPASAFRR